jgi:acetyl esterase/lipase
MSNLTRTIVGASVVTWLIVTSCAAGAMAEPPAEQLWPGAAPGAKGDADGDTPTLTIYLPPKEKANGAAVVICPGGGYGHLAMDHEGHQIGQWLNSFGVAGFILKYRHRNSGAGYGHPAPLQDVQRAIRTVRAGAGRWRIDSQRIGVLGFSAGGHLASTALTHFNDKVYDPRDDIDAASARPDFGVLVYPVISLIEPYTHRGSGRNLLGANPDETLLRKLSNEKQVTPETPPTFLVHTWEDKAVPPENSIYFYLALREAKVPAEMHIFLKGRHGVGLGRDHGPIGNWPKLCREWIGTCGFLSGKP